MKRCRSCDAEIVWAKMESSGKPHPFDAEPDPGGTWAIEGGVARHDTGTETRYRYVSHFATCLNAAQHRGRS